MAAQIHELIEGQAGCPPAHSSGEIWTVSATHSPKCSHSAHTSNPLPSLQPPLETNSPHTTSRSPVSITAIALVPRPGVISHKVSHLPCKEFSLQFPAFLLQSFNLLVFCQESTGLLCQVLRTLAGKCFFTQFQAGALHRHWSSYLHQRAVRCVCV